LILTLSSSAKADDPVRAALENSRRDYWMPAFAGMTMKGAAIAAQA
jgi:hypothetical protein